jgi:hypothetical protein
MAIVAAILLGLAGCQASPSQGTSSSASRTAVPPSTIPTETPSPTAAALTSQLNCNKPVTATHGLALYEYGGASVLGILDVSNPLKPALLCWLSGASGGRFVQAPNQVVFWIGNKLGAANLTSGEVVQTDTLQAVPSEGSFSADGAQFAYRTGDDTAAGMSLHLYHRADHRDITLYSQDPLGGRW